VLLAAVSSVLCYTCWQRRTEL